MNGKKKIVLSSLVFCVFTAVYCVLFCFAPMYRAEVVKGSGKIVLYQTILQAIKSPQLIEQSFIFTVDLSSWIISGAVLTLVAFCLIAFEVKYAKWFLAAGAVLLFVLAFTNGISVNGQEMTGGTYHVGYAFGFYLFAVEYILAFSYSFIVGAVGKRANCAQKNEEFTDKRLSEKNYAG